MIETGVWNCFRQEKNIQKSDEGMTVGRNETEMRGRVNLFLFCFHWIDGRWNRHHGCLFSSLNFRQSTSQIKMESFTCALQREEQMITHQIDSLRSWKHWNASREKGGGCRQSGLKRKTLKHMAPVTLHIVNSFFSFGCVNIKGLRLWSTARREEKIPVETNEETVGCFKTVPA